MIRIILFYILMLISFSSVGQKTFHLTINIDSTLDPNKLQVYCDNGMNLISATDTFKNNSLSINGKYYSTYTTVNVIYDVNSPNAIYNYFWITDKKATINLKNKGVDELTDSNGLVNAIDIYKINKKLSDSLNQYSSEELNNMSLLWKNAKQYEDRSKFDSLQREFLCQ